MAKLSDVLNAQAGVPAQVEAKFTMLPKVSTYLKKIAGMVPAGPALPIPAMATTAPTLPPLPDIFKGPTTTSSPLKERVFPPKSARGEMTYAGSPGSARGTLT